MKWYQFKEQSAGVKRLILSWHLYRIFGKKIVQIIAFFVAFFTFIFSRQIRSFTEKNLSVIYEFTNDKNTKPTLFHQFQNTLNYALSLVDRMETFAKKFDVNKISFENEKDKKALLDTLKQEKGVFFICSHIGNIEVLRTFIANHPEETMPVNPHVNIFLSEEQCKIFNSFLKNIEKENFEKPNLTTFPVEEISVDTSIELQQRLHKGEIAFMAGDRVSSGTSNITFKADFLNSSVEFPIGTFKLAQLMETEIYFICAIKEKNDRYKIYLKKFEPQKEKNKSENLEKMQKEYMVFLEKMTKTAPLQFYHFYDLFE